MDTRPSETFSFGAWLKARRRALGITQGDLARRVGVAEVTVRKIEADERRPSPQVAAMLADQLALEPGVRARFLLAARAALSPDQLPASSGAAALPLPPTPLIGRDAELALLLESLERSELRLLTLTGPPGIGKTRLALELAHRVAGLGQDRVTFVSLAPLGDPELVTTVLAQALDVTPVPGEPLLRRLVGRLQGRQFLVLDNFEQVLPAAPLVAELLTASADLRVVVTSRAALRLRAEHEFPVPPLGFTVARGSVGATPAPAVQLFVERARAVQGGFRLTPANLAVVTAICERLDGLPLAIELAAARTRTLSPQALLDRLDRQLDLLTTGPPDLPDRQRTLRSAIGWSYELLGPTERLLLDWLGVFAGGCTLDDLESVLARAARAAPAAALPAPASAADLLGTLIDHSLVRVEAAEGGELRFGMLETVRAFARERLATGDGALAHRCHAEHFCALAEAGEAALTTTARGAIIARLGRESDNLRAALDWALEAGEEALALRLGVACRWFWHERAMLAEGRAWLERLLTLPAAHGVMRARALHAVADLALRQGDYAIGVAQARESVALFAALGDGRGQARAQRTLAWGLAQQADPLAALELSYASLAYWRSTDDRAELVQALADIGWVYQRLGRLAEGTVQLEEALALVQGEPHAWLEAEVRWSLGELVRLQGDLPRARALFNESLALMRGAAAEAELHDLLHARAWDAYRSGDYAQAVELFGANADLLLRTGNPVDLAWATGHAGDARRCQGDLAGAAACYERALALFREHGHRQGEAAMRHNLGYIACARGELEVAEEAFRDSLQTFRAIGYTWSVADAVGGLAAVAAERGKPELAARLIGAMEATHHAMDASGSLLEPANLREWERTLARIATLLSPSALAAARAEGQRLSLDAAAELALTF